MNGNLKVSQSVPDLRMIYRKESVPKRKIMLAIPAISINLKGSLLLVNKLLMNKILVIDKRSTLSIVFNNVFYSTFSYLLP